MITPLDIQNKEFSKGVRGYKEDEVDGFLDLLTLDLEKLLDENRKLKDNVKNLASELERYRNSEGAVLNTLEAAKALMGDISASAERRAEILLKNAELDAELVLREAKESSERLIEEYRTMKNRLEVFKSKYRSLLESELDKFDSLSADLFSDKEIMELKSLTQVRTHATKLVNEVELNQKVTMATSQTITNLRKGDGVY